MSNTMATAGPGQLDQDLISIYNNVYTGRLVGPLPEGVAARPFVTDLLKPVDSFHAVKKTMMVTGVEVAGLAPVSAIMFDRLLTIIAQAAAGNGSSRQALFQDVRLGGRTIAGVMTIRQFMALTPAQQLAAIDQGWAKVCRNKAYNKLTAEMYEPTALAVDSTRTPVPTGVVPGAGDSLVIGHTGSSRLPDAYKVLGVGFRVDGSGANCLRDLDRIMGDGMGTQLKNQYLMRHIKGWEVQGTLVDRDTNAPRVWSIKDDLFNESAVCIARNLYGATAFPTREMEDEAMLYCVDVRGLIGFDTEMHQIGINRQWRPGEKAYKKIPKGNVIGHVRFRKTGAPAGGGWRFQIPANAEWTFVNGWDLAPTSGGSREALVRSYVTGQLLAWRGPERTISSAFDFA